MSTAVPELRPFRPTRSYTNPRDVTSARLQAAAQAAGEQARWLLPTLYGPDRRAAQDEVTHQLSQMTHMLRRAASAAPTGVCSARRTVPRA